MRLSRILILFSAIITISFISLSSASAKQEINARIARSYGKLPLSFVENRGQMDKRARFVIRGPRASAFFRNDGVTFDLWEASKLKPNDRRDILQKGRLTESPKPERRKHAVLKLTFKGADPKCQVKGMDSLPGKVNYMIGKDKSKWHTDVPTYKGVIYKDIWHGIDVIYRGDRRQLKYDIRVNPGADIKKVRLQYDGAQKMWLDKKGDLHIKTAVTEFIEKVPGIYQEKSGKKINVVGGYKLLDKHTVGFDVKDIDPSLPLVIDPASDLVYSTFLGGSEEDEGWGIAVDLSGCAYVTGNTFSSDFPTTPGAFDTAQPGADAFVTKLNSSGSSALYSTFLGGTYQDWGFSIAVDPAGCAYVAGLTGSSDFPTSPNAFAELFGGGTFDAFVAKLNPSGSGLEYSTYLGGNGADAALGIAVNSIGFAYLAGVTYSSDFPTTPGVFQPASDPGSNGDSDAFVAKLDQSGSDLQYSTYLGGVEQDSAYGIAVDSLGCAYVSGTTESLNFPSTFGAFDRSLTGTDSEGRAFSDAFVTKLDPLGSNLQYSTFLGGSHGDAGLGIALDSTNCAYITGETWSSDFPTTPGAFKASFGGGSYDAFVTKLNPSGSGLDYSTYLGGNSADTGCGIVVDSYSRAHVSGYTWSSDFPTTPQAFDKNLAGVRDAFVTTLNIYGSAVLYSTFLGGSGLNNEYGLFDDEVARCISINSGCVYVVGTTYSPDFPTTQGAFDTSFNGDIEDAFITKLRPWMLKPDLFIKAGNETSYSGIDLYSADGSNQSKSQSTTPGQKVTYTFRVKNAGIQNDSFKITGPASGGGWSVRYYDLNTNAEITSQVIEGGWTSGTLAPSAVSKGIFVKIIPDATVPARSVNSLIITAASVTDDSKIDVVKAVTSFIGIYKTDMLIKSGTETTYSGTSIFSTDGVNQTKSQSVSPNQKVTYAFKIRNAGDANDAFRITGPAGGSGWSVRYYDLATNAEVTSQVTGTGWVSGIMAPGASRGVYANVRPDASVPPRSRITLLITAASESDGTKVDVAKAVTTCVTSYQPDLLIRNGSESSYLGTDIINTDGTDQTKSQSASSGQKAIYSFRIMNAGYLSDSFKITGPAGGAGWSVKYYDLAGVEITSLVTGAGWMSGTLTPGIDRGFFVKVSPDGTLASGAVKTLLITAASISDGTKKDVVKAVTAVP